MSKRFLFLAAAAVLALAVSGCVPPSTGTAKSGLQLTVDGRPVTLDDLVKTPMVRPAIQRYITYVTLQAEAAKRGVKIDQTELQKKVEEQKQSVLSSGGSYEDFLKEQSITADEIVESLTTQMLFDGIVKSMTEVTEDDIKKLWNENKEQVLSRYLQENHLPESEKSKVTFEQAHDMMKIMASDVLSYPIQEKVMNMLVLNSEVKVTGSGTPETDKQFEDLILNFAKQRIQKEQAEKEGAPKMPGLTPPSSSTDKEATPAEPAPPADGKTPKAPPAEQQPPKDKGGAEQKGSETK